MKNVKDAEIDELAMRVAARVFTLCSGPILTRPTALEIADRAMDEVVRWRKERAPTREERCTCPEPGARGLEAWPCAIEAHRLRDATRQT